MPLPAYQGSQAVHFPTCLTLELEEMKIACPYCGTNFLYDHTRAGQTFACAYCKRPVLMPPLQQLPVEYQQEFRDEQERLRKKQEQLREKQEARQEEVKRRQKAEEDRQVQDLERRLQEERELREASSQQKEKTTAETNQAAWDSGRRGISYPFLRLLAKVYRVIAWVVGILGILVIGFVTQQGTPEGMMIIDGGMILVATVSGVCGLFLVAECIEVFLDVADDIRESNALLKRHSARDVINATVVERAN